MTLAPGIHDVVPSEHYHDGGTATPSLSASVARVLVCKSPAHARACHPMLNPDLERKDEAKYEIGTAAHKLFLEGDDAIAVYLGDSWRTNDAKAFRDEERSRGKIPLLLEQAGDVRSMVAEARAQLEKHRAQPPLFTEGKPEQTLVWEDDHGVVCRARLDWLRDDRTAIDDLKSTSRSADPASWSKSSLFSNGYAIQARFYQRGVRILTGIEPVFRFAVVETEPPYALSVVSLNKSAEALADEQIKYALAVWAECLENDDWPAYRPDVHYVDAPPYLEADWLEREALEAA